MVRSNIEDSEGAQGKRGIQAFRRKAWKQAKKETNIILHSQIILNCQELRILTRTKYEREVSIQKAGKKPSYILETSITQWIRNLVNSVSSEQNRN